MFECQLEIWLFHALEVALQKANEDVDCEPGIRYVFTQWCVCWCMFIYRYVLVLIWAKLALWLHVVLCRGKYFEVRACVCAHRTVSLKGFVLFVGHVFYT